MPLPLARLETSPSTGACVLHACVPCHSGLLAAKQKILPTAPTLPPAGPTLKIRLPRRYTPRDAEHGEKSYGAHTEQVARVAEAGGRLKAVR